MSVIGNTIVIMVIVIVIVVISVIAIRLAFSATRCSEYVISVMIDPCILSDGSVGNKGFYIHSNLSIRSGHCHDWCMTVRD